MYLFLTLRLPTLLAIWWRTHIQPTPKQAHGTRPRCIIVYRLDGLGDLVLTTPLLRELKQIYPKARCTLVVQNAFRSLLATNPYVDEILALPAINPRWLPKHLGKLISALIFYSRRLRGRQYDIAISPRWDTDEDLATFLCVLTHASQRVGFSEEASRAKRRANRGFDRAFSTCLPPGELQHEVFRNLAIAQALGAAAKNSRVETFLSDRGPAIRFALVETIPPGSLAIALGIGARDLSRKWPLERYAECIRRLANQQCVQPVILCAPHERAEALQLAGEMGSSAIIIADERIRLSCAALERCHLFIGNDSGCAHLAAAMNCKTIVISRHPRDGDPSHSNSPFRFAPHCAGAIVLQPETGLHDCDSSCKSAVPHCITQVTVDVVVEAAQALLSILALPDLSRAREEKEVCNSNGLIMPSTLASERAGVARTSSAGLG